MSIYPLFKEVSKHQLFVEKNKTMMELFSVAFEVTDSANEISMLQKQFIITEICYSYCHIGYSLFCNPSILLAKEGLMQKCGISEQFIEKYLHNLKEFLFQEVQLKNKEDYFSSQNLEISFAKEFIKRIFCTEKEEDFQTGLSIYSDIYISKIRSLSSKKIAELSSIEESSEMSNYENEILFFDSLRSEFFVFLFQIKNDPLTLIVNRFESFIHFLKPDSKSIFIFRENTHFMDDNSKKMTALLTLLVPHKHNSGQFLFKETLLTTKQMSKIFSREFQSKCFNLQSLRSWLGVDDEAEVTKKIESLMEESLKYGVVFKVPHGKESYVYGLSDIGMKIIRPFHSILTDSFLIHGAQN